MGRWHPSPATAPTQRRLRRGCGPPSRCGRGRAAARECGAERSRRDRTDAARPASRCIAERGRMGWQRASGYNWRALVEADISRWKRVIGAGLRFQTDKRRATEVAIAANVLNRMLELGRPEYVRIA